MNKQGITLLALLCLFACSLSAQTRAEYWLDADPGQGHATAFYVNEANASVDIPTDALSYGWHIAGIRVHQSRWSQTYTHRFYKAAPKAEPGVLSGVEYWVNTDPGQGQATALPFTSGQADFALDLPTEGLEPGFHIAGLRVRYDESWSQTYTHRFFIAAPAPADAQLTAAEYWVDADPGQGKALPLAVSAGQSEIALDVMQIDTLPEGYHTFGVRVRYGEMWSQTYTHRFLHTVKHVVETHIEAVEAYWDGNTEQTFAIPFVQQGDSAVIEGYDFDTKDLTYGVHYLYLYAKANGVKSIITRYEICKNAIPAFEVLDEESICVNQEVLILDASTEVQPETTYAWDMNGDGKVDYTTKGDLVHTYTKAGTYTVTLTVQTGDGCESVYSHDIYVHPTAAPSVSLSSTKSKICAGESVTFTAKPTNEGQNPIYTWYRNDQEIEGATEAQLILDDLQNGDKIKVQLTTDNPCAETKTAMSKVLTQTVNPLPEIELLFAAVYYTDDKAFSLGSLATPTGGTFYINDAEVKLFNPKNSEKGIYTVRYTVTNSNGCTSEAQTTFELKDRTNATITALSSDEKMGTVTGGGTYPDGTKVTLTATAETGYHFVAWQDGVTTATREITVNGDATYTATFAVDVFVVSFVDWNESELKKENVEYGKAATAPADPEREGYTFTGWDKDFSNITADLIVTAQYNINRYEVLFVDWNESELKKENVEYGKAATAPADPEREGYTFTGWDKDFDNITADLIVTAQYEINRYEVLFLDWDETELKKDSVDHGSAATAPADPKREGYTFTGWDKEFDNVTENMVVTALYEKVEEPQDIVTREYLDLSVDGITIEGWTFIDATLNEAETDVSKGRYILGIDAGKTSITYVTSKPRFQFEYSVTSDKPKALYVYPGKCFEFGGKNGIINILNTAIGDTIKLEVAAKGATAANFDADPDNARPITEDLTLPAKGSAGGDNNGYVWRTLEYRSKGGDVAIKETTGGYRIRLAEVVHVESSTPTDILSIEDHQGTPTRKVLVNGQIFILRGEKIYTIQGQKVK